jgi:xylulokinase
VLAEVPGISSAGGDGPQPGFGVLCDLAATAAPGSGGILFTPWLAGERSPVDDRNARAGFHNLSLSTGLAAMVRAVLEGVAYNNRWLHEAVERFVGHRTESIRVFGGGAQSDLWCQIHADVLGRTVEQLADPVHANLRGAAILAGLALGDLDPATARSLIPIAATFAPDPSRRALYDRMYAEFPRLYKSQKAMFSRLNGPRREQAAWRENLGTSQPLPDRPD